MRNAWSGTGGLLACLVWTSRVVLLVGHANYCVIMWPWGTGWIGSWISAMLLMHYWTAAMFSKFLLNPCSNDFSGLLKQSLLCLSPLSLKVVYAVQAMSRNIVSCSMLLKILHIWGWERYIYICMYSQTQFILNTSKVLNVVNVPGGGNPNLSIFWKKQMNANSHIQMTGSVYWNIWILGHSPDLTFAIVGKAG